MLGNLFKEKSLDYADAYYQARRSFQIDPNQDFISVKNRIGLVSATTYAQIYFSNSNRYKKFRRELDLHSQTMNAKNHDYDVLIVVPPRGSVPQRVIQHMIRQTMGLSTSAGFSFVSTAHLNTDRVLHGAKRLKNLILEKKKAGRKLILVSHSFGSAFVRVMLDNSESQEVEHVKGWVNLSGLVFGSPLFNCSDKKTLLNSTTPSQRTFSSEQKYFRGTPNIHQLKVVHFLSMLNNESLSRVDLKQKEKIKAWGPSDGCISFEPYRTLEQTVVPLMDQSHVVDLSKLSLTFVRTLSSIVSTLPMPKLSLNESHEII